MTKSSAILCDSSSTEVQLIDLWLKIFTCVGDFLYRNVPKTFDEQKLNF